MAHIIGELMFGLGLFFLGLRLLGDSLKQIGSSRFRELITRHITSHWHALAFGVVSGAIMQSTSAALVILASLNTAGLVAVPQVLPVISGFNLGVTVLVFLAVCDVQLAVFYLAGLSGIALHFAHRDRVRAFWTILLGVGLIFFGINMLKGAAGSLSHAPWFSAMVLSGGAGGVVSVLSGTVLGFVAQSSTVVAMLSIGFVGAGALPMAQALLVIYGAVIGSNLFRVLLGASFTGTARQLVRYQNLLNLIGAVTFILLFFLEERLHIPLVMALLTHCSRDAGMQVFIAFFLLTLTAVVFLSAAHKPVAAWLEKSLPAAPEQDLAQPKYLPNLRPDDAPSALDLIQREQIREIEQVCALVEPLREGAAGPTLEGRREALLALGGQVRTACHTLTRLALSDRGALQLAGLQETQAAVCRLTEAVYETFSALQQARSRACLADLALGCLESLEFLLLSAKEALAEHDAHNIEDCLKLCQDRGPIMQELRQACIQGGRVVDPHDQILLLDMTIGLEKSVWMLRRLLQVAASAQ